MQFIWPFGLPITFSGTEPYVGNYSTKQTKVPFVLHQILASSLCPRSVSCTFLALVRNVSYTLFLEFIIQRTPHLPSSLIKLELK
jgi:hypothetical protein